MKLAWIVLLISAFTDFIITVATGLTAAMVESASGQLPTYPTLLLAVLGGLVAAARTIQQALKATPTISAALKGELVKSDAPREGPHPTT